MSYISIVIALLEAGLTVPVGLAAGSVALLGFGLDSLIEVGSSSAVLWGMAGRSDELRIQREKTSLKIVGALLLALAAYIAYDSLMSLLRHHHPQRSLFGVVVLALSLGAMLWLRRSKRAVAAELSSDALAADSKQTEFCAYLSAIALAGLGLNAVLGLWWADQVAAMIMIPIIVREGIEAVQGKACCHE